MCKTPIQHDCTSVTARLWRHRSDCDASWRSQAPCPRAIWCKHRHFQLGNPREKFDNTACEQPHSALCQGQNCLGISMVFPELPYLFVLGAQFLPSQSFLTGSMNLYWFCPPLLIIIIFAYMLYRYRGISP